MLLTRCALTFLIGTAFGYWTVPGVRGADLRSEVEQRTSAAYPTLETLYQHLHSHPELSLCEEHTAARIADELVMLGFKVTRKVGGHGFVGVLENGAGPTILVRTDLDGLPVIEQTGAPYASKVTTTDDKGNTVGVMHACGHDVHMTVFVGTARVLTQLKERWHGTLVMIGQPAEERVKGADRKSVV